MRKLSRAAQRISSRKRSRVEDITEALWGSKVSPATSGLDGVKLIVGDKCMGMLEAVGEVFSDAKYQRCTGAFLPQCFLCCAKIQGQNCGKNAQGDPRAGE